MLPKQLHNAIIEVLTACKFTVSDSIVNMLFETACVESDCGKYVKQVGGPACGVFQIEPNTAKDMQENFIKYRTELQNLHDNLYIKCLTLEENLCYNLAYSIFMCRIYYMRIKKPIPKTKEARAEYWKKYYNTDLGKGTVAKYLEKEKVYGNFN